MEKITRKDLRFNKLSEYALKSPASMDVSDILALQTKYTILFNAFDDIASKFVELWNNELVNDEELKEGKDYKVKLYDLLERMNFPMVSEHTGEVLNINELDLQTFRKLTEWWLGLK